MLYLQKLSYMNYIAYLMKITGLYLENFCVEKYNIFKNLVEEIFFSLFTKVYVRETPIILRIFELTKVSHFKD